MVVVLIAVVVQTVTVAKARVPREVARVLRRRPVSAAQHLAASVSYHFVDST